MKIKFPNKTKLDGVWYQALQAYEIKDKDQKKFLESGALLVAEYVFVDEEIKEEEVVEPVKEEPKATPKKDKKQK